MTEYQHFILTTLSNLATGAALGIVTMGIFQRRREKSVRRDFMAGFEFGEKCAREGTDPDKTPCKNGHYAAGIAAGFHAVALAIHFSKMEEEASQGEGSDAQP